MIVTVTNAGHVDAEEVVQLYLSHSAPQPGDPLYTLVGFQRVTLAAGETQTVEFTLPDERLTTIDDAGQVKEAAKALIADVMAETGVTSYTTRAGKVAMTAPGLSVSYDAKALDAIALSDARLAAILGPHRKETQF